MEQKNFNQITISRHLRLNDLLKQSFTNTAIDTFISAEQETSLVIPSKLKAHQSKLDKITNLYSQCKKCR
jgi:hypothetical protein